MAHLAQDMELRTDVCLNLGILESCGDDGASLGVVDKEAFAPRKKLQRINNFCPELNISTLKAHALQSPFKVSSEGHIWQVKLHFTVRKIFITS